MQALIASILNFFSRLILDPATKLKKEQKKIEFYNKAFDFLVLSYHCWGGDSKTPTMENYRECKQTVNQFNKDFIENKFFFNFLVKRRFKRYIALAQNHSSLWSNKKCTNKKFQAILRQQNKILQEIEWLAPKQ